MSLKCLLSGRFSLALIKLCNEGQVTCEFLTLSLMSDSTGRQSIASLNSPTDNASISISSSILSAEEGDHIVVKCGVVEGKFYYGRLNCSSGNLGTVK